MTDEQDRIDAAEQLAGWYFNLAVMPQRTAFKAAMEAARGFTGPRWDRARTAARAKWNRDTEAARKLFEESVEEILATGEVSEATSYRWDELTARQSEAA